MSEQTVKVKGGVTFICHGYGTGPTIGCRKHLHKFMAALGRGTSNQCVSKHEVGQLVVPQHAVIGQEYPHDGGISTYRTPLWVVTQTVFLDLSIKMFHLFASVGASTILRLEVRIVFPGC